MTSREIIEVAKDIAEEYRKLRITLTLRQLYYQFVARGLLPSGQKTYARVGQVLTKARYEGVFPVEWIDDRGRTLTQGDYTFDGSDTTYASLRMAKSIQQSLWHGHVADWMGQPNYVIVVAEKDAVANILLPVCRERGVAFMAFKGYPSVSALRDIVSEVALATSRMTWQDGRQSLHTGRCQRAVILYLGDHDPDGLEIPHAAERGIRKIMNVSKLRTPLTFKRIALTRKQIEMYKPPPFEAKTTSSRFKAYVEKTGLHDAWELDALEPTVMRALVVEEITKLFDDDIRDQAQRDHDASMQRLVDVATSPGWLTEAFNAEDGVLGCGHPSRQEALELLAMKEHLWADIFEDGEPKDQDPEDPESEE